MIGSLRVKQWNLNFINEQKINDIFLIFPGEKGLDILYRRPFGWNIKAFFFEKKKKYIYIYIFQDVVYWNLNFNMNRLNVICSERRLNMWSCLDQHSTGVISSQLIFFIIANNILSACTVKLQWLEHQWLVYCSRFRLPRFWVPRNFFW